MRHHVRVLANLAPRGLGWTRGGSLLLLSLVGCMSPGRAVNPFQSEQRLDAVLLRVDNQNIHGATLFILSGKERREVGSIQSTAIQFFEFGWPGGTPLSMEIELDVGERYRPPPFPFSGGGQLRLTIARELRRSYFSYMELAVTAPPEG